MYTIEDVLVLLDQQEDIEYMLTVDLEVESEDEDTRKGDFKTSKGTKALLCSQIAQRDSLLLFDRSLHEDTNHESSKVFAAT